MARTYSNDEIAEIVENEGLGYTISDYMSGESIANAQLAQKWNECRELMHEIREILSPGGIQSLDEPHSILDDDDSDSEWDDEDDYDEYDEDEDEDYE